MVPITVLLVDDEPAFLEAMRESLSQNQEFTIDCSLSGEDCLNKLLHTRYDVMVADYCMPDMDGIELLKKVRTFSTIPFILFTGKGNENVVIDAINNGVDYYLKKGEDYDTLFAKLTHMIRQGAQKTQTELMLRENELKFRELFENSSIATLIYDNEKKLVDINTAACSLFGISSASNVLGLSLFDHSHISEESIRKMRSGETFRENSIVDFDEMKAHHHYHGSCHGTIYIDISFIPHKNPDGVLTNYYLQITDLTAQHRAEEDLKKTGEKLTLAIEGSQIGIWDWNVQTGETTFNERWAEIIGYTLAELMPITIKTWEKYTHPDDLSASYDLIQRHFSGELPYYQYEARMRHKNGSWVWIHDRGRVTEWDNAGRPARMVGTHVDITERKKAEEALRQKTEQIEQFFSVTLDMLCIANTDGYFTLLNPAWYRVLGWSDEELMGRKFLDFIHPDDLNPTLAAISNLADQKEVINFVNRYRCKDGTYRWIEWRSAPVKNVIYAAARDITEQRLNEERLIHKKNILDAISFAATTLMSSLTDDAISRVIARIGKAVEVSRTYIFIHSYSDQGTSLISQRYEWVSVGITPQLDNPALQNLKWQDAGYGRWGSIIMSGGVISGSVSDFPVDEQISLIEQDIKSLAIVPIFSHNEFYGFIGFDHCVNDHGWTDVEIETLEAAAGLLGAAFGRRKAEEEVQISENNFSTFFDTIHDFLFVLDKNGTIVTVNKTVLQRLGYKEEELVGHSILMVHPVRRRQEAFEIVSEMVAGNRDLCPIPLITKDGTQIPVETRVVVGEWDGHEALFGVSKDISAITLSEEKFSKAFHSSGSLMAISIDTVFMDVNNTFLETLGYKREEVIGKNQSEIGLFVDDHDRDRVMKDIQMKGNSRNNKVLIRAKDGRVVTGILNADIITLQDKTLLLTVMNDVTEMIRLSDALLQANKKLNLLSSITRHDLLNQVQALFFIEDFLSQKIHDDASVRDELLMLNKTVATIHS
ncbi:MAG: PAS domain S-box protein [Methanospirillum sp.]|uniref:PAS domain S-box protein n=1 Tax=Methanospirillum sp. TaxID=45200 RepID=UPI0023699797|nr:PAS domain S-box protein [Methanospirillum sp.]MDD1727768.1 PAS domain S-box protein [Methanospirillum sp.]